MLPSTVCASQQSRAPLPDAGFLQENALAISAAVDGLIPLDYKVVPQVQTP